MLHPALLLALGALPALFPDAPKPVVTKYHTSDGVTIGADYYAPKVDKDKKAPLAILIHMYPEDRRGWDALIPDLHEAGFAILAYDTRGKGVSVEPTEMELPLKYGTRDPALFTAAWHDVEGGKKLLAKEPNCDVSRIVLIGASVGCSIAIDYARRDPDVKAVVCLSPYPNIMGLDTAAHIKECAAKPASQRQAIMLMSPQKEYSKVVQLVEASGGAAKGEMLPGGAQQHGSNMLSEPMYAQHARDLVLDFIRPPVGLANPKRSPPAKDEAGKKSDKKGS